MVRNMPADMTEQIPQGSGQISLVTGGLGFIGSHLVNQLLDKGHHVLVVDKCEACAMPREIAAEHRHRYELLVGDIADSPFMRGVFQKHNIVYVFHVAAETHVDNSFIASFRFTQTNVVGTQVLLECCAHVRTPKRFVHVSTDEVYGTTPENGDACDESSILDPTNPYSATKAGAEAMVRGYGHSYKIDWVMVRGNNAYGPGQYKEKVVPKWFLMSMEGKPFTLQGDGKQTRSFVYVGDFARAIITVFEKSPTKEVYNIGGTEEIELLDLGQRVHRIAGNAGEPEFISIPDRQFNDLRYIIDAEKIKSLGWDVEVNFEEGLQRTFQYYYDAVNAGPAITNMPIKSEKSRDSLRWLIWGGNGWIGSQICEFLESEGEFVVKAESRADDQQAVLKELRLVRPDRVMSFIGRTHGPGVGNIDYVEDKLNLNIRDNLMAPLTIAMMCKQEKVHFTYLGTGCIFDDKPEDVHENTYNEESKPNYFGSAYSIVKGHTDNAMKMFTDDVLTLRIRMPFSAEPNDRNLITKLCNHAKVIDVPNSMSSLEEILPAMVRLARIKKTGTLNMTNPGVISHNQILELYKKHVDPSKTWVNFTLEEQDKILKAKRCNCNMDTELLQQWCPEISPIHRAFENAMISMGEIVNKGRSVTETQQAETEV